MKRNDKYKFYRNFGDLSNDSVVCDIYIKRMKSKKRRKKNSRVRRKIKKEIKICQKNTTDGN